jgi:hypothetical protein
MVRLDGAQAPVQDQAESSAVGSPMTRFDKSVHRLVVLENLCSM